MKTISFQTKKEKKKKENAGKQQLPNQRTSICKHFKSFLLELSLLTHSPQEECEDECEAEGDGTENEYLPPGPLQIDRHLLQEGREAFAED